jgi:VanZ family protein
MRTPRWPRSGSLTSHRILLEGCTLASALGEDVMRWRGSTLKAVFITGVMGVIALSLLPPKHTPSLLGDKLEHLIAYAFLGLVGGLAFQRRRATLWLIALLPSLAIALELAQEFAPGRSTEIADAAVSAAGSWLSLLPWLAIQAALERDQAQLGKRSPHERRLVHAGRGVQDVDTQRKEK